MWQAAPDFQARRLPIIRRLLGPEVFISDWRNCELQLPGEEGVTQQIRDSSAQPGFAKPRWVSLSHCV